LKAKGTQRLDKVLSSLGIATRSELKKMAKQGRILVNNKIVKDTSLHLNPELDEILVDGQAVIYKKYLYLLMNKPQGVISATEDLRDRTVIDLLTEQEKHFAPFPVGRLDKDTEGLLLLTNDGKLAHQLLSPRKHVDKTYFAKLDNEVGEEAITAFRQGVQLDDGYVTMPAVLNIVGNQSQSDQIEITIQEGKYHQVKRMFEAIGRKVIYLQRIRMGTLHLDRSLPLGSYRELTESELEQLQSIHASKRSVKLLALDVDGTLLRDDHSLSERNIASVRKVVDSGIEVVLCTGRGAPSALPVFKLMGLSGTIISHNGAATVLGDDLALHEQFEIGSSAYKELLIMLRNAKLFFDVSTAQSLYVEQIMPEAKKMYDLYEVVPEIISDFTNLVEGIVKVTVYEPDPEILDAFEQSLPSIMPTGITMVRSGVYFIDFMIPSVNKGVALANYAKSKGYKPEQVIAIGNYNNDIEMLNFAGIGIAVSNSTDEVLEVADFVVASNNEDGVSDAIVSYVLASE
jgi:16S rRNA pseudouridine516 synthase